MLGDKMQKALSMEEYQSSIKATIDCLSPGEAEEARRLMSKEYEASIKAMIDACSNLREANEARKACEDFDQRGKTRNQKKYMRLSDKASKGFEWCQQLMTLICDIDRLYAGASEGSSPYERKRTWK